MASPLRPKAGLALLTLGAMLLMAGRFNPDTLVYKEHFLVYYPPPDEFHMEYESHTRKSIRGDQ
ncbi:MAG: hypothetical protein IPJ07_06480 [Acidobacteria bacterium]|nr:hypothetical protein [Acidobacteriota bacterium]